MLVRKGTFSGANVFLSRNLVPSEIFDTLHDALRLNGAQVFLCCDPSRNTPNDYHIISSPNHEKFEYLRSKGCNLVGPQCILSCAKEHRMLPKRGYTCCLAMDGVKIIASGFDRKEKAMIEEQVTCMSGVLQAKTSNDVNFVIVKNVLSAKYKWALNSLQKPPVNLNWLCQCWIEHRVVPQEPYRVLPFTGLTICFSRIPADERQGIKSLIIQNGGQYSADLTKQCSHLVSDAPSGDKYVAARTWGHIHIVNRKWIHQSISIRACLDERLFPVHENFACNDAKILHKEQAFHEPTNETSQLNSPSILDEEVASSQNISIPDTYTIKNAVTEGNFGKMEDKGTERISEQMEDTKNIDFGVAQDSEEDNDLYLSTCRICLLGFEEKMLRKLLNMIKVGGGTRHMSLCDKLTHIILGTPSEADKKEVRRLATWGVINVVNFTWLEECDQAKREVPVSSRHIFSALMNSKGSKICMETSDVHVVKKVDSVHVTSYATNGDLTDDRRPAPKLLSDEKNKTLRSSLNINGFHEVVNRSERVCQQSIIQRKQKDRSKSHSRSSMASSLNDKTIFKGKSFCFSSSFPIEPRTEVIEWINGGGGVMLDDQARNAIFIIECHGASQVLPASISQSTAVSTHWIRSSIEGGCMEDVASHILYSPLRCHIPLPGFEDLRFCVSQYEGNERILLKNLCFILGAKFTEKLNNKITHLLCKFTNGPKYDAACRKGIQTVTAEWIAECVSQDKLVPTNSFQPRPVTLQDKEAGLCTVTQCPTQAVDMFSFPSQSQSQPLHVDSATVSNKSKKTEDFSPDGKRLKIAELNGNINAVKNNKVVEVRGEEQKTVPDVADAIEDLLAQSDKIQDQKPTVISGNEKTIFAPDHPVSQTHGNADAAFGILGNWLTRPQEEDNTSRTSNHARNCGPFDPFSETQTDSQVVGYEEDLSGRQKIIERVRSQTFTLTPDVK